jgi:DNA primase
MDSEKWLTRKVDFRVVRLPSKQDPADVVERSGIDAMQELLKSAVPVQRFEVERALEQTDASTDELLAAAAQTIAPMRVSVLRAELVKLVSDRLGLGEQLVNEVLRAPAAVAAHGTGNGGGQDGGWGGRQWDNSRQGDRNGRPWSGNRRGGGGRDRFRPMEPPEPADPRTALIKREQSERAFLAYCLALPDEGEQRLAAVDIEDYFSTPATRQAAAYLRGRLRAPAASLPTGDEALARLVAELVIRAGALEATPAKLELEALQLDLHRLERHISNARLSGDTSGVGALAVERRRVHDEIRHRLT